MRAARDTPLASSRSRTGERLRPEATRAMCIAAARSESDRGCKSFACCNGEAAQKLAGRKAPAARTLQLQDVECVLATCDSDSFGPCREDGARFTAPLSEPRTP